MHDDKPTAEAAATVAEAPKLVIEVRQLDKLETTSFREVEGPF
ncbi:hypothetical protein [Kribbella sp. C-35]